MKLLKNEQFKKNKKKFIIFLFSIPLFLSSIYFYSIGRKRYIVNSDIIVRKATNNSQSSFDITNIIGAGNQSSTEDSLFLQTYLQSPQVLKSFDENFNTTSAKVSSPDSQPINGLVFVFFVSKDKTHFLIFPLPDCIDVFVGI